MYRVCTLCLVALAVAVFVAAPTVAADKAEKGNTHEGKVVNIEGNKLTMVDKSGKNEHTHTLAADAKITVDGKAASAEDLKKGMAITVTTSKDKKVATRVVAKKATE